MLQNQNNEIVESYLTERRQRVESFLSNQLVESKVVSSNLYSAIQYAALGGGKRLRPMLVYAAGEDFGVTSQVLDAPACAVELAHAFSLVHDDLPAMDNDDWRRGKLSCHKAFDEATAILAGDAMLVLAFQVLASSVLTPEINIKMLQVLTQACGASGMTGGQDLDIHLTTNMLTPEGLLKIYYLKTGAMIEACVILGAIAANNMDEAIKMILTKFAYALGLAFQIQDDILECELSECTTDNRSNVDLSDVVPTYPQIVGLQKAKDEVIKLFDDAFVALDKLPFNALRLRWLTNYIMQRKY